MCKKVKARLKEESYALTSKRDWKDEWGTSPYLTPEILFIYRIVSGIFWLSCLLYDFAKADTWKIGGRHWTFLSNWTFLVTSLYFITASLTALTLKLNGAETETLPCVGRLAWAQQNISTGMSLLVTVAFWSLQYDGNTIDFDLLLDHGIGTCWILADILLTYNPLFFKHIYQPVLIMLIYVVMTIIYDYSLEKSQWYVYSYINWSEDFVEALYMSVAFSCVLTPLLYVLQALLKPQLPRNIINENDIQMF